MEFPSLNLSYILAPFWTGVNDGVIGEVRCEQYGAQERVGATLVLDKVANFIIETDPDVGVFNPTWMLLCEWNNVSSAQMLPLVCIQCLSSVRNTMGREFYANVSITCMRY